MAELSLGESNALSLSGNLLAEEVEVLLKQMSQSIASKGAEHIELDISQLQTVNSIVLSVLLNSKRRATEQGKVLKITGASSRLYDMARVGGLESLLNIEPTT